MTGDRLRDQVARIPSVRSHTATFVRMEDGMAVVNTGETQIRVACIGYYPPRVGVSVQVEWRAGRATVVGPAVVRNPIGEITGTGSPTAEVTVDGVAYQLPFVDWYTPVVTDVVKVDWISEVIEGKLSISPVTPDEPGAPGSGATAFDLTVRAQNSGKWDYSYSNWWGGSEVWASDNNDGIWVYGNSILDAVGGAPTFTRVEIFLPLYTQAGSCSIGTHAHPAIPGGAPTIGSLTALAPRGGWVELPVAFGAYLAAGGRGIGVTSPSGGFNKWAGVGADSLSGALRLIGTR